MDLQKLRESIDNIDDQLLTLLVDRIELVKQVGHLKQQNKSAIYRPEREQEIIERLSNANIGLLNKKAIETIFLEIFAVSRNFELPEWVAYLGPEGSFTHQAAESRFGSLSHYVEVGNIKGVFNAVAAERARFGVVPVENNQEGVVEETIDLLGQSDVKIIAEVPMDIHFSFASNQDEIREIDKIFSKDIAFRQCENFIQNYFPEHIELIPVESTSKAARLAKETPGSAAICSSVAARIFKLPILFHNIEDSRDNITRFLILAKDMRNHNKGVNKTSILAMLSHRPGALAEFLQDFYLEGINLTKIDGRPAKEGKSFNYNFYIDFEGHIDDEKVQKVISKHQEQLKWLGSYPKLC